MILTKIINFSSTPAHIVWRRPGDVPGGAWGGQGSDYYFFFTIIIIVIIIIFVIIISIIIVIIIGWG